MTVANPTMAIKGRSVRTDIRRIAPNVSAKVSENRSLIVGDEFIQAL